MRKINGLGKFLGGGLRWILGGPIGGLVGFKKVTEAYEKIKKSRNIL